MRYLIFTLSLLLTSIAASKAQIPAYTANQLVARTANKDTTYIINFWASWCGPCVKELPEFNKLQATYAGRPVKVILASFDFKDAYPDKLKTYVQRKGISPEVIWWSETNATEFIPKIDSNWSGGLPATLVVNARTKYHTFIERPVTSSEIEKMVAEAATK